MSNNNYTIHSIIAAYGLGIAPHGYYLIKMMANAKGQSSNILGQVWDKLARARGAHLNALEGIPMFAAAMLAGNLAKLPSRDLNYMAVDYLAARVLYTAVYMGVKSELGSYLRTGIWAWSISIPIWLLLRAGNAINDGDI
ncbi:hypothetical protein PENSTE_c023G00497 [Penicillium steckii]|uniref:Uncharacterized protein n=1 Tax=Penicillium steckii TaxID=303698 RepID=A0A1V6SRQ0_9EURO|nr:hypothetical protein PENSTE_c023G00497 [Penicillium steckii]